MSGLEPLAALGLACSVMQTITFAGQTLSLCRKIYNDGQPDPALNDYTLELSKISETLKNNLNKGSGVLSSDDLALRDTAEKCLEVANKLALEMQDLSPPNNRKGVRTSIRLGLKTTLRNSRLKQLETSLKNIQSAMNTQLLVRTLDRVDASGVRQDKALADSRRLLEETIQKCSSKNENKLDLIARESVETRDQLLQAMDNAQTRMEERIKVESSKNTQLLQTHIAVAETNKKSQVDEFQEWKDKQNEEIAYQSLLQSLKFENMQERKNQITENYPQTCRWIFKEPSETEGRERLWDSFVDWLKSKAPIYWISGKPGSGKSTLMKFISSNPKTKKLLNEWQPESHIFSHYFWKAGSEMQQTLKGLLCSLMYQIFCENRQVALDYIHQTREIRQKPSTIADWDMKMLEALLQNSISKCTGGICLFIDGLDEFTPQRDYHDLLFLVDRLSGPRVKLCLSSRPEQVLQNHLQIHANLRMQDLTEGDMRKYAAGCLGQAIPLAGQGLYIDYLVSSITRKADGVFLWVVLVSKSLVRGIENGDSGSELMRRLESMPGDLAALYKDMWLRLNEDREIYQTTASWFFNIIFAAESADFRALHCMRHTSVSVFELMAAADPNVLDRVLDHGEDLSTAEIDRRCSQVARAVEIRSAGLLEVSDEFVRNRTAGPHETQAPSQQGQHISVAHHADMTVRFIHRTARDYLLDSEDGRSLWQTSEIPPNEARTRLIKACLLRCHIWSFPKVASPWENCNALCAFIKSARRCMGEDGSLPIGLLSAIERTHERGKLWSRPVFKTSPTSQEKPEEPEATFLAWAGLSGLVSYTVDRIPRMQARDNLRVCLDVLLQKFCQGTGGSKYIERSPLIRCLLQQGAAPNLGGRSLISPWILYLSTMFETVSRYRWGMDFSRKIAKDVSRTLRVFLEAGASPLWNIPVVVLLDSPQLNYRCVEAYPRHTFVRVAAVVLIVNHVWLINEIIRQLDPEANVADIGYDGEPPYARVVMAAYNENVHGTWHRCWLIPDEDAFKITGEIVSCLRSSVRASNEVQADLMKKLRNMMIEVKGRSEPIDELRVPGFLSAGNLPHEPGSLAGSTV